MSGKRDPARTDADAKARIAGPDAPPGRPPAPAASLPAEAFAFRHPVEVRFRDLDPMGHAHHSLPLIYFEEARAAYWRDAVGQAGLEEIGYVIAHFSLDFHARILWPQRLEVLARVSRVGARSWGMQYQLRTAEGDLLASGESTQVMYDYVAGGSVPIPPALRARLTADR